MKEKRSETEGKDLKKWCKREEKWRRKCDDQGKKKHQNRTKEEIWKKGEEGGKREENKKKIRIEKDPKE